jgi:hypothetical protein
MEIAKILPFTPGKILAISMDVFFLRLHEIIFFCSIYLVFALISKTQPIEMSLWIIEWIQRRKTIVPIFLAECSSLAGKMFR